MKKPWYLFASYNLWLQFAQPVGQEHRHCAMRRGYTKARKKETVVANLLLQDNIPQRIGILAQQGVYEFHQNLTLLSEPHGIEKVGQLIQLSQEEEEVQEKVFSILANYYNNPILVDKRIIQLSRGNEGVPEPILIRQGNDYFKFYAAIDCIFLEPDNTLHILDFKTGQSQFDKRQAYVYLLAAKYLYPHQNTVASFYNLETENWSNSVNATPQALQAIQIELSQIAKKHQKDLKRYRSNPQEFEHIFPANPSFACKYCPFHSICRYSHYTVEA